MKHASARARAGLSLSMIIFGTIPLFTRSIPLSSSTLALSRAVLAACFVAAYLRLRGNRLSLSAIRAELPMLLLSGMTMGVNWILLFEAYRYTTVSIATLSYYFAPVIVAAASPFLFKEKMSRMQIFCFAMATIGLTLVIGVGDTAAPGAHMKGILFGFGAACLYATVILLNKRIKTVSGLERTLIQFIGAIAVLTPYVITTGGVSLSGMTLTGVICLLVLGLVHTGMAYAMYFSSLKELKAQTVALVSYLDPVVALLLSGFVLNEPMTPAGVIGAVLVFIG